MAAGEVHTASAAAAGRAAALTDVAAAAGPHLGPAGQAEWCIDACAGDLLEQLRGGPCRRRRRLGACDWLVKLGADVIDAGLIVAELVCRIVLQRLSFADLLDLRFEIGTGRHMPRPLGRGVDAQLRPLLEGEVVQ